MSIHLYVAPASTGKTAYVMELVRDAAQELRSVPRVVVPTHVQARAWRRRLAEAGGAIGVRVLTFDQLYAECLGTAGEVYTELSEPVQHRLIRAIVDELPLAHYAPLTDRPGFVQVLKDLIGELKAARVWPDTFAQAVAALGDEPRLRELALVYAAYQERVQAQGWADRAGLAWLATEALEERAPDLARDWPLLVVDGFDNFTPVQLALLKVLASRVETLIVTLTGTADGYGRTLAHRRFDQTRQQLEETLDVRAAPLPEQVSRQAPALAHLEAGLFCGEAMQFRGAGAVELIAAPDRAAEVRAALRWLKAQLVEDGMRPAEVALLARDVSPYRPLILQTAAEFGLPVRLVDGLPLRTNPAVAALLDLLRLMLPHASDDGGSEPALLRRPVVEAWRSPYFDWSALPEEGAPQPIGIGPGDADALDGAARWGRVIGGLSQWEEVLADLVARPEATTDDPAEGSAYDEERGLPAGIPAGSAAQALRTKFRRFVRRLTPPQGQRACREFVGWLEALIGPDPVLQSPRFSPLRQAQGATREEPTALQVVARAREGAEPAAGQDVAALQALKDVLRGLVWAEEALGTSAVEFSRFFDELSGVVEASGYRLPLQPGREEILVADVVQARGVPFRAVAVLGLAEGEFPATLSEDPFLRDADRGRLRQAYGLPLEPSTESEEAEFFYETVTRPRERLLLTRPRLADNGARWQASPFWEEICRLVTVKAETLTSETVPTSERVASWPELMESLATHPTCGEVQEWIRRAEPGRQAALDAAAHVLRLREGRATGSSFDSTLRQAGVVSSSNHQGRLLRQAGVVSLSNHQGVAQDGPFDGDLSGLADGFAQRFGPNHTWSASRLEAYRICPFFFFVGSVLYLEPRDEPAEGLDVRQLGNIYHRILEKLYQEVADPADLAQLLKALPAVARRILDAAPRREGFRQTAWWAETRAEIVENARRSVEAMAELQGDFFPYKYEAPFGLKGQPPLVVRDEGDSFRMRGYIDRVDRAPDGRVRVIDYKTSGPHGFTKRAAVEGKKVQVSLYALAARDALGLGEPAEGFYWHVQQAEPSGFTMSGFDGGPEGAIETAVEHAWEAVRSARGGHFVPHPPADGCPAYCPATAFCWHYRRGFGG
jgi:ATP-dependent helicase/DNAse subunit B